MKSLKKAIGGLDAEVAGRLASAASDVTLVLDREGVVKDLVVTNDTVAKEADIASWIGRRWVDTVTVESRAKVEQLLREPSLSSAKAANQWRQVNHPSGGGRLDLPMRYATMPLRSNGAVIALGREMRTLALMQQKLLESQQAIEREYARVRFAEMRYRLLFQMSQEAIVILDAATLRVIEANPAAQSLFVGLARRLVGKPFTELFEGANQTLVQRLVDSLRAYGQADAVNVKIGGHKPKVSLAGSMFKQEQATHLLLRLTVPEEHGSANTSGGDSMLKTLVDRMPDAFVVTGTDRRVLTGNAAFLNLAELASPERARGESIDRWLGRSPAELNLMLTSLNEHGSVRKFPTILRGELGSTEEVEVSAVFIDDGQPSVYGFTMRTAARAPTDDSAHNGLPYSINQMTALVGQVPLKNLVRETTDLIERMCIEAALQIVGDNRASAAEMLGLSRQGLYIKLRRYGLGDLGPDDANG